jgi:hypothetical protein
MRKHVLTLTASAVVLACSVIGPIAQAQSPAAPGPDKDTGGMMGHGMMGHEMMGHMMGHGIRGEDDQGRPGRMGPIMMRMMFALMDADGDGKLSLQEFQAAHERIFKAMDANKDGFVTLQEMQEFIRGTNVPTPQQ